MVHRSAPPPDTAADPLLEAPDGTPRRLSSLRGRPVVLFWETRERTADNDALKRALHRLAAARHLEGGFVMVAVGDVAAFDFTPARGFVRAATRAIASAIGIEVWLDFRAAFAAAPWGLRRDVSNVIVLAPDGRVALRRSGVLDDAGRAEVLALVERLAGRAVDERAAPAA